MRRPVSWQPFFASFVLITAVLFGAPTLSGTAQLPIHAAPAAAGVIPSWPAPSSQYLGRYHLTASSAPMLATSGELTIFLRVVPKVPQPALSGILSLKTKTQTNVLYLTAFKHTSSKLWTSINLGIFTGPVLGSFVVTSIKGDQMTAQFVQATQAPITFSFVRFSHNPHP